jgi:acylphosphatase
MAHEITKRCLVSGKVQGVFFRASTREEARSLGVDGWARNLADGRVEVVARGEIPAVDALCEWLREGPSAARVDDLHCEETDAEAGSGFRIL